MKVDVINASGKQAGTVEFPDEVFATPVNETLLWQAVEGYRANLRQGTAKTKTRSEVEGSKRKLFPQKHLGRARMGSSRSGTRVHGGVPHGPKPRSYRKIMSQAIRRRALLEALKQKLQSGKVTVIEDINLPEPKTKLVAKILTPIRENSKVSLLIVPPAHLPELMRASRNLASLDLLPQEDLNAYAVWRREKLVLFKSACEPLIARWK